MDDPNGCIDLIVNRRGDADVEAEEGEIIEDYFANRLRALGYDTERADVFIPNGVASGWFNRATGDNRKVAGVARTLKQLREEHTIWRIVPARKGGGGERGFRWIGEMVLADESTAYDLTARLAQQTRSDREDG